MTDKQRQAIVLAIAAVIGFAGGRYTAPPTCPDCPEPYPRPIGPGPWDPFDPDAPLIPVPGPTPWPPRPRPGPPTPGPDPFRPDPRPDPLRPGP
jgi:hypothetical protein